MEVVVMTDVADTVISSLYFLQFIMRCLLAILLFTVVAVANIASFSLFPSNNPFWPHECYVDNDCTGNDCICDIGHDHYLHCVCLPPLQPLLNSEPLAIAS